MEWRAGRTAEAYSQPDIDPEDSEFRSRRGQGGTSGRCGACRRKVRKQRSVVGRRDRSIERSRYLLSFHMSKSAFISSTSFPLVPQSILSPFAIFCDGSLSHRCLVTVRIFRSVFASCFGHYAVSCEVNVSIGAIRRAEIEVVMNVLHPIHPDHLVLPPASFVFQDSASCA